MGVGSGAFVVQEPAIIIILINALEPQPSLQIHDICSAHLQTNYINWCRSAVLVGVNSF